MAKLAKIATDSVVAIRAGPDAQPSQSAGREGTTEADHEQAGSEAEEQQVHPGEVAGERPSFEHEG